jgi:hypothetical protein
MHRLILWASLFTVFLACPQAALPENGDAAVHAPQPDAPLPLKEAWLRFHELDLCRELDLDFLLNDGKVQIWTIFEKEKSYRRFLGLFAHLQKAGLVELYPTRLIEKREMEDDFNPPPSLRMNYELRAYFGDPDIYLMKRLDNDDKDDFDDIDDSLAESLKYRLVVYAKQVLALNLKIERTGRDISTLYNMAVDPQISPDLRSLAIDVCKMHVKNLARYLVTMNFHLIHAFPNAGKNPTDSSHSEKLSAGAETPADRAMQISADVQIIVLQVRRFIYPKKFDVNLDELRQPGIIESIKTLQKNISEFQKSLEKLNH